jgi:osmotically-inducible protein OsmY
MAAALTVMALALLLAGCAGIMEGEVEQEPRADAVLATRIKADLLEVPELNAAAITVESDQGRITLTGFVNSREQKQRAERMTREVEGVKQVVNRIEVK